jgi:hypothetical protein
MNISNIDNTLSRECMGIKRNENNGYRFNQEDSKEKES